MVEDKSAVAENYLEHCKPMQAISFCQHGIQFPIFFYKKYFFSRRR